MYCLQLLCAFMHYLRVSAPIDTFVPSVSQCTGIYNYNEFSDMIFSYLSNILIWLWPFRVLHVPSFLKFYQCHMQQVSRSISDNSTRARRARSQVEIIQVRRAIVTLPSLPGFKFQDMAAESTVHYKICRRMGKKKAECSAHAWSIWGQTEQY